MAFFSEDRGKQPHGLGRIIYPASAAVCDAHTDTGLFSADALEPFDTPIYFGPSSALPFSLRLGRCLGDLNYNLGLLDHPLETVMDLGDSRVHMLAHELMGHKS
jgi:hypothetical protein